MPGPGWRVHTSIDIAGVRVRHGDFVESDLARAIDVPERNRLVVDSYKQLATGRHAIVFCSNVAHAQALAAAFTERGIAAAAVWGAMPPEHRRDTLRRFGDGEVSVLTNCDAGWRAGEPTEKQIAFLRRRGIPTPGGLTRGQASWMISMLGRPRPRRP